jgi:rubrerythrin
MNRNNPNNQTSSRKSLYEKLILEYQKRKKIELFNEAKKNKLKIPMLQVDGVLMNPEESLHYLKLHLEAYQKAKEEHNEVKLVCPACGSPVIEPEPDQG